MELEAGLKDREVELDKWEARLKEQEARLLEQDDRTKESSEVSIDPELQEWEWRERRGDIDRLVYEWNTEHEERGSDYSSDDCFDSDTDLSNNGDTGEHFPKVRTSKFNYTLSTLSHRHL